MKFDQFFLIMKINQQIYSLLSLQNKLLRLLHFALRTWSRVQARYQYIDLQQAKRSASQNRTLTPSQKAAMNAAIIQNTKEPLQI